MNMDVNSKIFNLTKKNSHKSSPFFQGGDRGGTQHRIKFYFYPPQPSLASTSLSMTGREQILQNEQSAQ